MILLALGMHRWNPKRVDKEPPLCTKSNVGTQIGRKRIIIMISIFLESSLKELMSVVLFFLIPDLASSISRFFCSSVREPLTRKWHE